MKGFEKLQKQATVQIPFVQYNVFNKYNQEKVKLEKMSGVQQVWRGAKADKGRNMFGIKSQSVTCQEKYNKLNSIECRKPLKYS